VTISQPVELNVTIAGKNDNICFGNANGSITVNVSGGTPGYTYAWTGIDYLGAPTLKTQRIFRV
jgi:hypothetical protein